MKIDVLPLGEIGANCYMLSDDEFSLVIDPGMYDSKISSFLKNNAQKQRHILLTHSHFDHIGGAMRLREETDTDILICEKDAEGLFNSEFNLSKYFGVDLKPFYADKTLADGEIIRLSGREIKCIETAGHSPGSMCFLIEDCLFSGDTLFCGSIGRTDFPYSNYADMMFSLRKLSDLDSSVKVYPGHGEATTIGYEKKTNPFFKNIL